MYLFYLLHSNQSRNPFLFGGSYLKLQECVREEIQHLMNTSHKKKQIKRKQKYLYLKSYSKQFKEFNIVEKGVLPIGIVVWFSGLIERELHCQLEDLLSTIKENQH